MTTEFELLTDLKKAQASFVPSNLTKANSYLINYQEGLNVDKILDLVQAEKATASNLVFYHFLTANDLTTNDIQRIAFHFSLLAPKLTEKGYNTILLIREYNEEEHSIHNRIEIELPDSHAHYITVKRELGDYDLHVLKLKSDKTEFLYQETLGTSLHKYADVEHQAWKDIPDASLNSFIEQESSDFMINLLGLITDNKGYDFA